MQSLENNRHSISQKFTSASSLLLSSEMFFGLGPVDKMKETDLIGILPVAGNEDTERSGRFDNSMNYSASAHSRSIRRSGFFSGFSSVHSIGNLLPSFMRLRMARDCCAGLAFLHSKGFMHCDIKSLNFLGK